MRSPIIAAAVIAVLSGSASPLFAMTETNTPGVATTASPVKACKVSTTRLQSIQARFAKEQTERHDRLSKDDANLAQYRTTLDQKTATRRAGWDAERDASFAKLQAKPSHHSAAAITTYIASIRAAVATKRSAEDAETVIVRAQNDQTIVTRRASVQLALVARNAAILSAAQTLCGAPLKTAIASAQATFKASDVQSFATAKSARQLTLDSRKTQESTIIATFKASINAALQAIKAATPAA